MRTSLIRTLVSLFTLCVFDASADETFTLTVPATANIFGAGGELPGGGTLPLCITKSKFKARTSLVFTSVTGRTLCLPGEPTGTPDGNEGCSTTSTSISPSTGPISGISAPGDLFLIGVFTDNPVGGERPNDLNLSRTNADEFRPKLNQTFFVGDGRTGESAGQFQRFVIPRGAKRFCLGFADAFFFKGEPGFFDTNVGSLTATFSIVRDGVLLSGTVTDALGPVANERLEIEGTRKKPRGPFSQSVKSDANGAFAITVPEGNYTISPATSFRFPRTFVPASGQATGGRPFTPVRYRAGNNDRTDLDFQAVEYLATAGQHRTVVELPGRICTLSEQVTGLEVQINGRNPDATIIVRSKDLSITDEFFLMQPGGPYESATFRGGECRGNLSASRDIGLPVSAKFADGEEVLVSYGD